MDISSEERKHIHASFRISDTKLGEKTKPSSFTSSDMPKSGGQKHKLSIVDPKLLEMVIKTINKRPSVQAQFQEGLAQTAQKTWKTELINRKKSVRRKDKVVESISSNLGLAKGYRHEFKDEAENLLNMLFKEINQKKASKEEDTSLSSSTSEEEVEEESDAYMEVLKEEPLPIPEPPKASVVVVTRPRAIIQHNYVPPKTHQLITRRESIKKTQVRESEPIPKVASSVLNVKKLKDEIDQVVYKPSIVRTYVEAPKTKIDLKPIEKKSCFNKKIGRKELPLLAARKTPPLKSEKITAKSEKSPGKKIKFSSPGRSSYIKDLVKTVRGLLPVPYISSKVMKVRDIKSFEEEKEYIKPKTKYSDKEEMTDDVDTEWGKTLKGRIMEVMEGYQGAEDSAPSGRRPSKKRMEATLTTFDKDTKQYIIDQIKEMLDTFAYTDKTIDLEVIRKRERKSLYVLWKNYFDIKYLENVTEELVGFRKIQRNNLLNEVDFELVKMCVYRRVANLLGEPIGKTQWEQRVLEFIKSKTNLMTDEMKRLCDKRLEHSIQILKEQADWCRTPGQVLQEEERRKKLIENYHASLVRSAKEYGGKRPNTRETTLEEILEMRGFRGPIKNRKHTIWIKKPEFMGYLKPMKKKPRAVYEPSIIKDSVLKTKVDSIKSEESFDSLEGLWRITVGRSPVPSSFQVEPSSSIPIKRPLKRVCGFRKYFGSLSATEKPLSSREMK